jgi:hypothetical protein
MGGQYCWFCHGVPLSPLLESNIVVMMALAVHFQYTFLLFLEDCCWHQTQGFLFIAFHILMSWGFNVHTAGLWFTFLAWVLWVGRSRGPLPSRQCCGSSAHTKERSPHHHGRQQQPLWRSGSACHLYSTAMTRSIVQSGVGAYLLSSSSTPGTHVVLVCIFLPFFFFIFFSLSLSPAGLMHIPTTPNTSLPNFQQPTSLLRWLCHGKRAPAVDPFECGYPATYTSHEQRRQGTLPFSSRTNTPTLLPSPPDNNNWSYLGADGVVVSIIAFQAIESGSIPDRRSLFDPLALSMAASSSSFSSNRLQQTADA